MVRITAVGLSLLVFAFAAMVQPRPSQASCRCRCVEGETLLYCSKSRELSTTQVRCRNLACPPMDVRLSPSKQNKRCRKYRVMHPRTGRYQWRRMCLNKRQAGPAEEKCKKVDFINSSGLYDTKTVCPGDPQDDTDKAEVKTDGPMRWYRKSAEQGDADSQFRLGFVYEMGQGVPQDFVLAHMWYSLAAAKGGKEAASSRDFVAKRMTPIQITKAKKLTREWLAKHKKK